MRSLIAAYTSRAPVYPGYLNFSREDDGSVTATMRGDPSGSSAGETTTIRFSAEDWETFKAAIPLNDVGRAALDEV